MRRITIAWGVCLVLLAGCSGEAPGRAANERPRAQGESASGTGARAPNRPRAIDPRRSGLEISLGEWAVTPEASTIRPGRVVFVIRNRGTIGHGFEIKLDGDSSGPGSGDGFEAETELLRPGESTKLKVTLRPGVYEIECIVEGHDDMGMENVLEVRRDAPLTKPEVEAPSNQISIVDFDFSPDLRRVDGNTKVIWDNDDPTTHTVSALDGRFGSGPLDPGESFSVSFDRPGLYEYRCEIHPDMTGAVRVN